MKVFISWSGARSRFIAENLRSWLPRVLQLVRPWMSDVDISAGARWFPEVSNQLSEARVGLICVTPENQLNPWLLFEAGAISKTVDQTFVCPILLDLALSQLTGPLAQFQASQLTREGINRIVSTLNRALKEDQLPGEDLTEILEVWWPRLDDSLKGMPTVPEAKPLKRSLEDMIEETVVNTREQLRRDKVRFEAAQALQPKVTDMTELLRSTVAAVEERRKKSPPDGQSNADVVDVFKLVKLLEETMNAPLPEAYLKAPPTDIGGTKDGKA